MRENPKFSALPGELLKITEAEKVRDCILVSLLDELIEPKEHLDDTDILDVVRDAIDVPTEFLKSKMEGESQMHQTVKTSRVLEKISLHNFTKKSLSKCGMYLPFPK